MKDFFISYNKADKSWAEWIAWELEQAGKSTIIQAWDFGAGGNFVLAMQKASSDAQRTIVVLSPDWFDAAFTWPEFAAAFVQDPTGEKRQLLPVRVRECDISGLLKAIVYIDLVGLDEQSARQTLLEQIETGRRIPPGRPPFPGSAPGFPA